MKFQKNAALVFCFWLIAIFAWWENAPLSAADLPQATQKLIADSKLDPSILDGLDRELAVPRAWLDGARGEGTVRLSSTLSPNEVKNLLTPFQERYPFIKVAYSRGTAQQREMGMIVAFKEGRYLSDVISSYSGAYSLFVEANALDDMRDLPGYANLTDSTRSADGLWVAYHRQFYCTSYNTNLVKKEDLPKKWEDILSNPVWRNGVIGVGNIPQLWLLPLWTTNGDQYVADYIQRFFNTVKPQARREGASALVSLVAAGELKMSIPASDYRVASLMKKGAPVAFHCPDPVPTSEPRMSILKGNPHINASKILVNWVLSKEGQISLHAALGAAPIHKDLQRPEFIGFPDQLLNRNYAVRTEEALTGEHAKLLELWNLSWGQLQGGGK